MVVHVLSHGPTQNIFPRGGGVRGIFKFSGGIQNIFGMRNFILCKLKKFKFSRRRGGGGHHPQLKPPLDLRMYTVIREDGKGAVIYTSRFGRKTLKQREQDDI